MSNYNYYTPVELAALLLKLVPQQTSIHSVIDICCGSWNLLSAAKKRYPRAEITGVDIDPAANNYRIEGATFVCKDGRTFANQQEKIGNSYDLVLSNPPFGRLKKGKKRYKKTENIFVKSKRYEAEMFWANLKLMHENSFLIIILPSTYVDGSTYIEYRKWLAHNYTIHAIVKLPVNTFENAILNTVAIILEKTKLDIDRVKEAQTNVYKACYDSTWSLERSYSIELSSVLNGIWYKNEYPAMEATKLKIFRGSISSKYFSETGEEILHCSSIFIENRWSPGIRHCSELKSSERKYLKQGDVVVNRIGRCAGYWSVYTGVQKLVSDCLIIIKDPTNTTIKELEAHSESGRLKIPLRGVSTPYITIDDIRRVLIKTMDHK
jgi:methyltransferase small domain